MLGFIAFLLTFVAGSVMGVAIHCLAISTKEREEFESELVRKNKMD